jgi:hypothetical protein
VRVCGSGKTGRTVRRLAAELGVRLTRPEPLLRVMVAAAAEEDEVGGTVEWVAVASELEESGSVPEAGEPPKRRELLVGGSCCCGGALGCGCGGRGNTRAGRWLRTRRGKCAQAPSPSPATPPLASPAAPMALH